MIRFRWTIKRKLLALGAATMLPLLLLLAYWVWWEIREHTASAESELILASAQAAAQVVQRVEEVTGHLQVFARDPAVEQRLVPRAEEVLRRFLAAHGDLENVVAFGADGRPFASAMALPPAQAEVTVADRPWFRRLMGTGHPVVSGFLVGRIRGQPIAVVAVPLRTGRGAPAGALSAGLKLRRMHALFESLPLAGGRTVTVVDAEGQVLSHAPAGEKLIGRRLPSAPPLPREPTTVRDLGGFDGRPRIAAVSPVGETGWRVLVAVPRTALEARIWKEVNAIGVPLLALLAVSSLIGLLIARRVWRPLQVLTEAARRLPQGEELSIDVRSTDEVGALARNFRDMAAQLNESRARLERRASELESLSEAGRLLTGTLDLSQVLQRLAELTLRRTDADVVRIWLSEPSGGFRLHGDAGTTRHGSEYRVHLGPGEGLVGWIAGRRETLVLTNMQDDPRLENRTWVKAEGLQAFLGVPIVLEDAPVGALAVMRRSARAFSSEDVAWAETAALPAAVAVQNARLYEIARTRARELAETNRRLQAAQEQLVRSEALRAVGELAAGMAHHLNNILAVIRGRVQLLLKKVDEPGIRRPLEIVDGATLRAAEVVRRVQEFAEARPLAGPVPVDLNRLVAEALELNRPQWRDQAEQRGAAIEVRSEPGEIPAAGGDPASLREVLVSLLLNAVDALPAGGQIIVRTWASGDQVCCSVADTGQGMAEEVRRRALEPFFTAKGPQRTGLGLSLSHGIIQRHGGTLDIDSAPGHGTTVTFSLPIARPGPAAGRVTDDALAPARPRRVLVIDDEAEVRETLAEILASQGHEVTRAPSGAEGLSAFAAGRHDLVFTDLGMAGMTGWQVAEAVKALSPATPVILVTGWGDEPANPGSSRKCVDQILRKPFDLDAVASVLAAAAGESQGLAVPGDRQEAGR